MDGGAYVTLSPVVLSRGALHATGPYTCPNVRIRASVVATNTPPNGAFRGFGAPQTLFAAELQMEQDRRGARARPASLVRRRNMVRRGSVLATGQRLRESVGAGRCSMPCVTRSALSRNDAGARALECATDRKPILARARPRARLPRRRLHRPRRGRCSRSRVGGAHARRLLHGAGGVHRDRPGHDDDAGADDGGCARRAGRLGRRRDARHVEGAQQRAHRRQPHRA